MKNNYLKLAMLSLVIDLLIIPNLSYAQSVSGTQTRTVTCQMRENGSAPVTVADNLCPQPKPATLQPCSVSCRRVSACDGGGPDRSCGRRSADNSRDHSGIDKSHTGGSERGDIGKGSW